MLAPGTFQKNPFNMLAAQALADACRNVSGRFKLFSTDPRAPLPTKVKETPSAFVKGDAETGFDLYRGYIFLAGHEVNVGANLPFSIEAPTTWHRELHSFVWLRHLDVGNNELHRALARSLVSDWVNTRKEHPACAVDLDVTARRLTVLLRHARFLLKNSSETFEELFYRSIGRHVRYLSRHIPFAPQDFARLEASIALCQASLCLDLGKGLQDQALLALSRELDSQILPDGGHVSREPMKLVELLGELLPLISLLEQVAVAAPDALISAVDRMRPMLRLLCHNDGGLAAFNGVGKTMRPLIKEIENRDTANGKPVAHAKYSGYARLSDGTNAVIIDCGFPPNPRFAANAHAGLLSFELSEGNQRIVVNCGAPATPDRQWSKLARTTPAHSTAILDHESSSHIADASLIHRLAGGPLHIGPREIDCELEDTGSGMVFEGRHDGYAKAYGIVHERRLWLRAGGADFRGEDRFLGERQGDAKTTEPGFAIRFHLHPSVKATLSRDGSSVMLLLANRSGWRFTAKGARLAIDESIYLVDTDTPQRTLQIVLTGFAARSHTVNWAFKKISKARRKTAEILQEPELPLG